MRTVLKVALVLLVVAVVGAGAVVGGRAWQRHRARQTLAAAKTFYQSKPLYLRPFPQTRVPTGLADLRAKTCGSCHKAIYEEWRVSTHARAWLDDAQFQEELAKSRRGPKDVTWMCINCHTPLVNQLPKLVVGLNKGDLGQPIYATNPIYDAALQKDAITCAVCHVRDGVVLGPYGNTKAPHPVRKDPQLLSAQICLRCHQATATFPELTLACVFNTGQELAKSRYGREGYTCQRCHMPALERPTTNLATPSRATRRHWFGGSLIPKKPAFEAEIAPLRKHYPDGLALRWVDLPTQVAGGKRRAFVFELHNAQAGHMLPTGDPERFIDVEVSARDEAGKVLARAVVRLGSRYRWYPKIELLEDTRLAPDEKRLVDLRVDVPQKGKLTLQLRATKHRISKENMAHHHLEGRYVAGRVFYDKQTTLPIVSAAANTR